ncbi:unnamed protein product [Prorocentrum cordatum]|uniref:Uncharacterized protein n=1 Tax=Prorocentrum cordatum TaxID=2364126 RepID=A0ABN9V294_9DINO|nr:unnamed protein product [Polarella glacialis]
MPDLIPAMQRRVQAKGSQQDQRADERLREWVLAVLARGAGSKKRAPAFAPLSPGLAAEPRDPPVLDWIGRRWLLLDRPGAPPTQGGAAADDGRGQSLEEVVGRVVAVMGADRATALTQERCCEALRQLVTDQASLATVAALRGAEAAASAMRVHADAPGVQGHCSGALAHLSLAPGGRRRVLAAGGAEAVLESLERHAGSSLVLFKGCAVLASLAQDRPLGARGFPPAPPRRSCAGWWRTRARRTCRTTAAGRC